MSKPMPVTEDTFESTVIQAEKPVLVDFWAEWCGPCKMIAPILDEIAQERADELTIVKLDVDANPGPTTQYGVMGIPTTMLFKGGEVVERIIGYMPKKQILAKLEPHLN